ncbi:zinc finger protein SNAI1 [Bombyx mori]|uniref:zinc finger protein SNAI1 n=1 Tax=Bombyx mori TaxID=7091 RepID=UPI00024B8A02
MSRVVSRVGLSRCRVSRAFPPTELEKELDEDVKRCVYMETDAEGFILPVGGLSAAKLVVGARLAPDVHARNAVLSVVSRENLSLQIRIEADIPPHHELLLWPDEQLSAIAAVPFLTPKNIFGKNEYVCHECNSQYEHPNLLKVHLLLGCSSPDTARFWRTITKRLGAPSQSAFTVYSRLPSPTIIPALGPAELEAIAAEWGRSRGAHVCVYCGKAYSRKYGLKIHIRTHTGYRPLRCRYCARAFGDPSNLNKHVRLHTGGSAGGAHVCPACGRALARRRDLERHLRAHAAADR